MRPIAPRTGAPEVTIAEEQEQYAVITAATYFNTEHHSPVLLMRYLFSPADRARVAAGDDLYIGVLTFGKRLQPLSVQVGPDGWQVDAPDSEPAQG